LPTGKIEDIVIYQVRLGNRPALSQKGGVHSQVPNHFSIPFLPRSYRKDGLKISGEMFVYRAI